MTDVTTASPSVLERDPLAGTPYRTLRSIGAGAMGQVFEAEHVGLRRRVAVKLLGAAVAGDPVFVDRLRLEAQALASVRHPNVVMIHDHAATPAGVPFLVLELLQGRTLQALLRDRGAIALDEALLLLDQVLSGLTAIHAAGLTHRDLKPANIFLCDDGGRTTVKLLDFGIVKLSRGDRASGIAPLRYPTEQGQAIGTPSFMAPEQAMGEACDARTDVYAVGVLLYLLLSGRTPFQHHRTFVAVLGAQVMEAPPSLSQVAAQAIPAAVEAVVSRALAKKPADRFDSITALGAALGSAMSLSSQGPAASGAGDTEKIPTQAWSSAAAKTEPLDLSMFRPSRAALPFAPRDAPRPVAPSFGLPPLVPMAKAAETSSAPIAPPLKALAVSPVAPSAPPPGPACETKPFHERILVEPFEDNLRLFALVVFLWGLAAVVAWRLLESRG